MEPYHEDNFVFFMVQPKFDLIGINMTLKLPICQSLASPPAKKQSLYQRPATGTATKVTTRISDPSDSDNSSRVKSNRPRKVKDEHERLRVQKESDDTRSSVSSNTSTHNITALTPNDGSVRQSTQEDPNMNLIVQRLREFAWTCEQSTLEQLRNEFDALPKPDLRDCKAFMSPENLRKNRYSIVHCSAGVGRSGTFVALEMCLQDLANGLTINVQQAVVSLRQYRALAVQTFEQYLSIYKAILQMGEKHGAINNLWSIMNSSYSEMDEITTSETQKVELYLIAVTVTPAT
ncbi:Protein-tyrosine phosphatase [Necator americanus]|uniref:Protein-tyrosine phosphatase n=1 Tax=Necator americanus TaxID=51031 RepID=W2SKL2_NECAM|nr:Protein-tyrosine phosphatase [Necator americanus]ETN69386.1 Protein-tyrosine phosphatase [Necator americanus]